MLLYVHECKCTHFSLSCRLIVLFIGKKAAETPEGHFAHHNHKQVRHGNVKIATAIADVFIVSLAGDQYRVCGLCCTPLPWSHYGDWNANQSTNRL